MDADETTIDSKGVFRQKAAWFSLLAPISSTVMVLVLNYFLEKDASDISTSAKISCIVGFLIIQIASLAAGILGMLAKTAGIKIVSLVGVLFSGVTTLWASAGLLLTSSGICG